MGGKKEKQESVRGDTVFKLVFSQFRKDTVKKRDYKCVKILRPFLVNSVLEIKFKLPTRLLDITTACQKK